MTVQKNFEVEKMNTIETIWFPEGETKEIEFGIVFATRKPSKKQIKEYIQNYDKKIGFFLKKGKINIQKNVIEGGRYDFNID